jgi:hypothetical protein
MEEGQYFQELDNPDEVRWLYQPDTSRHLERERKTTESLPVVSVVLSFETGASVSCW